MTASPTPTDYQEPKFLTGLVGRNILASRSPWVHEREADAQGVRLIYSLFDFDALGRPDADLADALGEAQALGFAGLNITFPFKQAVIAHLDALTPGAKQLGAVNTVQFKDGERIGHNTDMIGFAGSVTAGLPGAKLGTVVQFGAGGAGAATAHALLSLGTQRLIVAERDDARRIALVAKLRAEFGADRVAEGTQSDVTSADGIVNSTPMGMVTFPGTPFDAALLTSRQWVADIVYFPLETELLRQARLRGCATLDGSGMNVLQAAEAFEIFTGLKADRPRMLKSFVEFVSGATARAA